MILYFVSVRMLMNGVGYALWELTPYIYISVEDINEKMPWFSLYLTVWSSAALNFMSVLIYIFPEMKLRGLVPNIYFYVPMNFLDIPGSVCLFGCSKIGRPILGIYKCSQMHE
jgi:hypothetical protein